MSGLCGWFAGPGGTAIDPQVIAPMTRRLARFDDATVRVASTAFGGVGVAVARGDAADVYVVDQLTWRFVVADPALVDVTVSRGEVIEIRDDGQITIRVGNDPHNNNVNELGRVNAGSAPVTIQITVTVRQDASCGHQASNAARVDDAAQRCAARFGPPAALRAVIR